MINKDQFRPWNLLEYDQTKETYRWFFSQVIQSLLQADCLHLQELARVSHKYYFRDRVFEKRKVKKIMVILNFVYLDVSLKYRSFTKSITNFIDSGITTTIFIIKKKKQKIIKEEQ